MSANALLSLLKSSPQDILNPSADLVEAALDAVKLSLDPVAPHYSIFDDGITVQGLDAEQVWAQAQMVVDGVVDKLLGEEIPSLNLCTISDDDDKDDASDDDGLDSDMSAFDDQLSSVSDLENSEDNNDKEEDEDLDSEHNLEDDAEEVSEDDAEEVLEDDAEEVLGDSAAENDKEEEENEDYEKDAFGLNDGFFSIDEFNEQVKALDNNYGVDLIKKRRQQGDINNEDEDADEYDGENEIDYFADLDAAGDEDESENEDDIKYEDFFGPRRPGKSFHRNNNRSKSVRNNNPKKDEKSAADEDDFHGFGSEVEESEYQSAMDNVRKDLFESDNENDDESNGELKERQSTHEKEKEALMNQISQLENELVSAKPWALRGEARARDRPSDSLIEVDVEFERGSKPVPVITQEVTESLEDLIRRRVKNYEFDDLPRRNPEDAMAAMLGQQRRNAARKFELLETKSQQSLAEIYEADHQKKQDPNAWAASQGPSPLDQTHAEVKALFRSLSHTLDTLSSWNYTAGPPEESVTIVANTPAIAMEDAQPTSLADDDTLAPQEVYKVGQALDGKREVVASTSGMVVSKSEMTREERKRQRRREKTRRAKAYDAKEQKQLTKAQNVGSRANVLETLKKGNVTVIGARGEKRDIDGKLKKDVSKTGSTFLKL